MEPPQQVPFFINIFMKKAVFISDLHLASKKSRADEIQRFLKNLETDNLYMVGDIIDIWRFRQAYSMGATKQKETVRCIDRLLRLSKKTKIHYIWGNHDEFMARFKGSSGFGDISLSEREEYVSRDGRRYLVLHGHQFDLLAKYSWSPWVGKLGDIGYDFMISVNEWYNLIRRKMGLRYWSLSKYVKVKFKQAVVFIDRFEDITTEYARRQGYDGVICGHIHDPQDKMVNGIHYLNCGCWTDQANLTYIVDDENGLRLEKQEDTHSQ